MPEGNRSAEKRAFRDLAVGRYFVWVRSPELGPLMKANDREAVDDLDVFHLIWDDEEVLI